MLGMFRCRNNFLYNIEHRGRPDHTHLRKVEYRSYSLQQGIIVAKIDSENATPDQILMTSLPVYRPGDRIAGATVLRVQLLEMSPRIYNYIMDVHHTVRSDQVDQFIDLMRNLPN